MTALDILVLVTVGWLGFRGFSKGFTAESLSLAALVVAIAAVKLFHGTATEMLVRPVGTDSGASVLAFVIIFGITFVAGKAVAASMGKATRASLLGGFDRMLGFGFGAVKGLIGASLVFLFAALLNDTVYGGKSARPDWMTSSHTYPLLNATSRAIIDFVEDRRKNGGGGTV